MSYSVFGWVILTAVPEGTYITKAQYYLGAFGATTELKDAFVFPTSTMALRNRQFKGDMPALVQCRGVENGGTQVIREMWGGSSDTYQMDFNELNMIHEAAYDYMESGDMLGRAQALIDEFEINPAFDPTSFLRFEMLLKADNAFKNALGNYIIRLISAGANAAGIVEVFHEELVEAIFVRNGHDPKALYKKFVFNYNGMPTWAPEGIYPRGYRVGKDELY